MCNTFNTIKNNFANIFEFFLRFTLKVVKEDKFIQQNYDCFPPLTGVEETISILFLISFSLPR